MMRTANRFLRQIATVCLRLALVFAAVMPQAFAAEGSFLMPDAPKAMPEIIYYDVENKPHTLADLKGKTVVLHFWATWCTPCIAELPEMVTAVEKIGSDKVVLLPISNDRSIEVVPPFLEANGLDLPAYLDQKQAAFRALELRGLPSTILINAAGLEVARREGVVNWESEAVIELIKETAQ